MNKQIFGNEEIRFIEKDGEHWAVASDVAKVLGYSVTTNMNRMIDEDDKGVHIVSTLGGEQKTTILSEFGIYEAILNSRRDEAKEFKKWVKQILKELRHASGLESYEVFRMLDKEHQKKAMQVLRGALESDKPINFIKANTIANKAVSTAFGYAKMIGKDDMTPAMLEVRQVILDDVVKLTEAKSNFNLDIKVSKSIYDKYEVKS
ncbi:Bro-N domain-containing protein [Staphylococcus succinus]|uniref:BRO-N domain-containing protein n=1 Tax=Staphylococcus succinus TaxID=61015 RepID=UPI0024816E64|nr:Bro-N domain-containing protein [Staphylococcus succinus]MDH9161328.1 Bro-N domain-containing protein [Staphylococcus succinus]